MDVELQLVGGPYDGVVGPFTWLHEQSLWVRPHDNPEVPRARNGLICSLSPRPKAVQYRLLSNSPERVVFAYGDISAYGRSAREVIFA